MAGFGTYREQYEYKLVIQHININTAFENKLLQVKSN